MADIHFGMVASAPVTGRERPTERDRLAPDVLRRTKSCPRRRLMGLMTFGA